MQRPITDLDRVGARRAGLEGRRLLRQRHLAEAAGAELALAAPVRRDQIELVPVADAFDELRQRDGGAQIFKDTSSDAFERAQVSPALGELQAPEPAWKTLPNSLRVDPSS